MPPFLFRAATPLLALLLAGLPGGAAQSAEKKAASPSLARIPAVIVRGKPIFMAELNSPEIYKARKELFRMEGAVLREKVLGELRRAIPGEFSVPLVVVSPKEVEEFYLRAGLNGRGSLESYRQRIQDHLILKRTEAINQSQFQAAVAKGYVINHHRPPPAFLVKLKRVRRKASFGPHDAAVQMVEFSDFQCPFCRRVQPTLVALREKYGEKLHLVYRHLPLAEIHSGARAAAEASECAADQGKFWPYHDLLFENSQQVASKDLQGYARRAGVPDLGAFTACLAQRRHASRVETDLAAARDLGMGGTPSFFIGRAVGKNLLEGEVLSGSLPLKNFVEVIERFLRPGAG